MTDDQRQAVFLDELRRGGYRSGAGVIRHAEPDDIYPQGWGSAESPRARSHADETRAAQASWDRSSTTLPGLRSGAIPSSPADYRPAMDYPDTWAPAPRSERQ